MVDTLTPTVNHSDMVPKYTSLCFGADYHVHQPRNPLFLGAHHSPLHHPSLASRDTASRVYATKFSQHDISPNKAKHPDYW